MEGQSSSLFSLAPHRVLKIENETESKLALLAENSTGWALISEPDYRNLLSFFSSGPLSSEKVDKDSLNVLQQLLHSGLAIDTGALVSCNVKKVSKSRPPRTFLIKMTGSCNYSCEYCYDYNDKRFSRHLDPSRALEIIKTFVAAGQHKLRILFHGGEPLLRFDEIKKIVEEVDLLTASIQDSHISYSIQTNGYFLTPSIIDFLTDHDFSVGISCDGFDEQANSLRTARNGSSTLAPITTVINSYPDFIRQRVGFLAVVTKNSLPHITSFILQLQSKGIKTFSYNYMDEEGAGQKLAFQALSADDSLNLFRDLVQIIEDKQAWSIAIEPVISRIANLFSLTPKDYCYKGPCGASSEFMVLDADGGLRTCDCSDNEFFHFGETNTQPKDVLSEALPVQQQITDRHTYLKTSSPICSTCPLFGLCGGTCVAQAIIRTGDYQNVDPIECAISKYFYPYLLSQYSKHKLSAPIFEYFLKHNPHYSPSRLAHNSND